MSTIRVQFDRTTRKFSQDWIDTITNEKLKDYLIWCNEVNVADLLSYEISNDLSNVLTAYENDKWMQFDFVYDCKLQVLFINCFQHEVLMNNLYFYHTKMDLDDPKLRYQFSEEYIKKYGFYKSSASASIFVSEDMILPTEIMCLSHLLENDFGSYQ